MLGIVAQVANGLAANPLRADKYARFGNVELMRSWRMRAPRRYTTRRVLSRLSIDSSLTFASRRLRLEEVDNLFDQ